MNRPFSVPRFSVLLPGCCALALGLYAHGQVAASSAVDLSRESEPRPAAAVVKEARPIGIPTKDWIAIRAAYEGGRHTAYAVQDGYRARCPGQEWQTQFDGCGFLTQPDAGGWSWGLELESYGFADSEQRVTRPAKVHAEGGRVAYDWDAALEEWYINDRRGLEHGYTIGKRPVSVGKGEQGRLTFTLSVRGTLRPEVIDGGRGVRFLDNEGVVALTYTGLTVFDSDQRELEASFECVARTLHLRVDERGARYPLTIDPIAQQAYLKASNTEAADKFGRALAVWGNTVVVGAYGEDSNAKGVNGDQGSNSQPNAGAAYVFVRSGTSWSQQAYLKASNTEWGDYFGYSVALSGDTLVVGAYGEDSSATGIGGDQYYDFAETSGAAYVFVRDGTSWSQQAYVKASNTNGSDRFGSSVAISGDTMVAAALFEASSATGVNGDQNNTDAVMSGAAYVFVRNGTTWSQEAYLKASNTEPYDEFGQSLSVSGDTILVGAHEEDSNATGIDGDQANNSYTEAGAAYVFARNGTSWSQQAYLKASNTGKYDRFGTSGAVSGDTIVIGAYAEDSNATGVNGDQSDNSLDRAGAAYVFVRSGTTWTQQAYLKASNPDEHDFFGRASAIAGDIVVVGARSERSSATGVNGDQGDNSLINAGAAYAFVRDGTHWSQRAYLKASNTDARDYFALSVAVSGSTAVIGAPYEQSNATGVNGDQGDNSTDDAGAVYIFDLDTAPGVAFCFGDPGSGTPCPCNNDNDGSVRGSGCDNGVFHSGAQLVGSGLASISDDSLTLTTTHLEPHNAGLYFQANSGLNGGHGVTFGDGLRCAGFGLIRLQVRVADAVGTSSTTLAIGARAGVAAGDTKRYQYWYRTPSSPPCGVGVNDFNLSNGYEITWLP